MMNRASTYYFRLAVNAVAVFGLFQLLRLMFHSSNPNILCQDLQRRCICPDEGFDGFEEDSINEKNENKKSQSKLDENSNKSFKPLGVHHETENLNSNRGQGKQSNLNLHVSDQASENNNSNNKQMSKWESSSKTLCGHLSEPVSKKDEDDLDVKTVPRPNMNETVLAKHFRIYDNLVDLGFSAKSILEMYARDKLPIPDYKFRNGYMGDRHFEYWLSGLENYLFIKAALNRHKLDISNPPGNLKPFVVLDFGGSTGRVSRHFKIQEPNVEVITTDTNIKAIGFICKNKFGQGLHNDFLPPLNLDSNSVSLFTAFSVWTHMNAFVSLAWLKEVRRVLKPGGYAWITIMGDHTWRRIHHNKKLDLLYSHIVGGKELLVKEDGSLYNMTDSDLESFAEMPYPLTVFQGNWRWPYKPGIPGDFMVNTFTSYEFVQTHWGEILEVVEILPQNSLVPPQKWKCLTPICPTRRTGQDVVILRKR